MTNIAQNEDEPMMNKAIEDVMAAAGYDPENRKQALHFWCLLGAEYMAREQGRAATVQSLGELQDFVKTAQPVTPWPE